MTAVQPPPLRPSRPDGWTWRIWKPPGQGQACTRPAGRLRPFSEGNHASFLLIPQHTFVGSHPLCWAHVRFWNAEYPGQARLGPRSRQEAHSRRGGWTGAKPCGDRGPQTVGKGPCEEGTQAHACARGASQEGPSSGCPRQVEQQGKGPGASPGSLQPCCPHSDQNRCVCLAPRP